MHHRRFLRLALLTLLAALTTSVAKQAPTDPPSALEPSRRAPPALRVERHLSATGLEYLVVEPPAVPPGAELPMVVFIHGRGDRPRIPRGGSIYGLEMPVRLILPRGPERFRDGYEWMPVSAHRGESEVLLAAIDERVSMLKEATAEWRRRHRTRGRPIVVGFSQGGILAMTLALREPESLSEAIPMAGWTPPRFMPPPADPYAHRAPIRTLHGGDDRVLSPARTRRLVRDLERLGYSATYEEFPGQGHFISAEMKARMRALIEEALREMPESNAAAGTA